VTDRTTHDSPRDPARDAGVGELVGQMSEQVSRLVRDELQLAQVELKAKGKAAGIGAGLFGGAGLFAAYGLGVLLAAAVLGLATVVDAWLAALIVGVVVLAVAGVIALVGKKQVSQASPPIPSEAISGAKRDVEALKGHPPRQAGVTGGERR
jgi:uncharacterized membrane protein YqjE